MQLVLICFAVVWLLELLLWVPLVWRWRKRLALLLLISISISSGALLGIHLRLWTVLLVIISVYRIINLLRLVEGRTNSDYLYTVARRSSLLLILSQLIIVALAAVHFKLDNPFIGGFYAVLALQFIAALILVASTVRHLLTTRAPVIDSPFADRDLPTLSVAIPARNETVDLEECLQSLLTCDYPKLEILVLDDCSQEKRTPEIIRQFAHDGVRFIAGKVPPDSWLAKNYAYQQLSEAANGDILLFCGVDARFSKQSLRLLVAGMIQKKKSMMSIMPLNHIPYSWKLGNLSVQPSRYAWELALPRHWLQRPPVLSTCWLISHDSLKKMGGFEAIKRSISPESYFARHLAARTDTYSFMQSNQAIGVSSAKNLLEQKATAIRTRYPQMHRRPELVGLFSLLEFIILVGPLIFIGLGISQQAWPAVIISGLNFALMTLFYSVIVRITYRKFLPRGLWLLPIATIYDIGLLNYSMWQYEFSDVIWKDRNVCMPVMRVIPALPKLT